MGSPAQKPRSSWCGNRKMRWTEAVKVMIKLTNGEAHHLGYLPKTEPLKTQVGDFTLATCVIKDYRSVGNYNPSYIITEVEGM